MLRDLIEKTLELREVNEKQSYFVAKELALIKINILWYPVNIDKNINRLISLKEHILLTFDRHTLAESLVSRIDDTVNQLKEAYLN